MKKTIYHSKLTAEQIMTNIEVFSHEYGLPEAFFEPIVVFGSRRITEKPVDHREELYFVITDTDKENYHILAFVGSRNHKSLKLDITIIPKFSGAEVKVVSKRGAIPIWFYCRAALTVFMLLICLGGIFIAGSTVGIGGLLVFLFFAVYSGLSLNQISGYYKKCDNYIGNAFALKICDHLLYSKNGEKTKEHLQRDLNREVRNDEWRCPMCQSVNSNYVGTCGCGYSKHI